MPALLELFAVVAAIALLWPSFERIADGAGGRDRRFAETAFAIQGLPDELLPGACAALAAFADVSVQERLCGRTAGRAAGALPTRLPLELVAGERHRRRRRSPRRCALPRTRLAALRQRQRDGSADVREMADEMAAIEAESQPFAERYRLVEPTRVSGPVPLACATRWLESALTARRSGSAPDAAADRAGANALLLFAAALDGRAGHRRDRAIGDALPVGDDPQRAAVRDVGSRTRSPPPPR